MFEKLITATLNTPEVGLKWWNKTYRNSMLTLLGIFFGYLTLMWGLSAFAGTGAITLAMWGFIFLFTFLYWQPLLGQLGALVEWKVKSDDPNMKSTWRLYLMVLIAAIVVGEIAITLHLLGSKQLFPLVALVAFTYVLYALLTPGRDLDKYLKWIAGILLALALLGTYHEINPASHSQKLAKEIANDDIAVQDARNIANLGYVNTIRKCNTAKSDMSTWTPNQLTVYGVRCNKSIDNQSITLEELREYWPKEYNIWLDSQKSLVAGGKSNILNGDYSNISWWQWLIGSAGGLLLLHVVGAIVFAKTGLTILGYQIIKKDQIDSPVKATPATTTANYGWLMWLLIIIAIGGSGYYYREPLMAMVFGSDGSRVQTTTAFNPSLSPLEADKWKAQYASTNPHIKIPQDAWHGKFVAIRKGSYVADTVNFVLVFDPTDPSSAISFTGNCVAGTKFVPKVCDGYWNAGHGMTGVYKLLWDDPQGRTFIIKMYKEQYFRTDSSVTSIKEIRVLDKITG